MKRNVIKLFAVMLVIGMVAVAGAIAADDSITGTVEQTDNGIVISADDGDQYIVMGKDLSSMVGQTVKATGTLAEGKSGKIITVISVEPADQ
jgi:hypothetical protein